MILIIKLCPEPTACNLITSPSCSTSDVVDFGFDVVVCYFHHIHIHHLPGKVNRLLNLARIANNRNVRAQSQGPQTKLLCSALNVQPSTVELGSGHKPNNKVVHAAVSWIGIRMKLAHTTMHWCRNVPESDTETSDFRSSLYRSISCCKICVTNPEQYRWFTTIVWTMIHWTRECLPVMH